MLGYYWCVVGSPGLSLLLLRKVVSLEDLSSDNRSIWIFGSAILCMKTFFTKLSSRSSQLQSAALCLILEWTCSNDSLEFCVQRQNWNMPNVSFLISLNLSCSCITNASVVHFAYTVCGLRWWNMFFTSVPSEKYIKLLTLLSISSNLKLSIIGPWFCTDW